MNEDLKYNELTNSGPLTAERAFTISQLIVYRYRDKLPTQHHDILTQLAEYINEIEISWRPVSG